MEQLDNKTINAKLKFKMMETQKKYLRLLFGSLMILATALMSACGDDDDNGGNTTPDPEFDAPVLSITSDESALLKPGDPIEVSFTLDAEAGNQTLIVNRGGGILDQVALDAEATTFTYSDATVSEDLVEGETEEYEFILVDTENQQSDPVTFTADIAVYDLITLGNEEVFEVGIPADGIVPDGTDILFSEGRSYYIANSLFFGSGSSLTIQSGVTVYIGTEQDALVEVDLTGSEVEIIGTATSPVVMTSANVLTGEPAPGDWERFRVTDLSNSTIRYLRSEFADNGIRMRGCDDTNTFEYLQSYYSIGEGIYITGGNANLKYIIATNSLDGSFRLGDDYSGNIQFAISVTEEESGSEDFAMRETASPLISNVTLVGPGTEIGGNPGFRFRGASSAKVYNSIVADYLRRGVRINDEVVITDLEGPTVFAYSFVFNVPTDPFRDDTDNGNPFQGSLDGETLLNPFFNNILGFEDGDPILEVIEGIGTGDYIPDSEQASDFDPSSLGSFFDPAPFVGAIQNADNDWTATGWVKNLDGSIR